MSSNTAFAQTNKNIEFLDNHIYVLTDICGKIRPFAFDTGSPYTLIDSLVFSENRSQFKKVAKAKIGGVGNSKETVPIILDGVSYSCFGSSYISELVAVTDLKKILGDYCEGLVGIKAVAGKTTHIDYVNEVMTIYDSASGVPDKRASIDIEYNGERIFIPVTIRINDSKSISGKALLDIGFGGSVSITSTVAKENRLDTVISGVDYQMLNGGIGGTYSGTYFRAYEVIIGEYKLKDVVLDYSHNEEGAMSNQEYVAIIGNEILQRFDVTIDLSAKKLYLNPNVRIDNPFDISRFGFEYVDRGQTLNCWIVNSIDSGSQAELAGLRLGDRIVEFNGRSVSEIDIYEQQDLFDKVSNVVLKVARPGENVTIDIAEDK